MNKYWVMLGVEVFIILDAENPEEAGELAATEFICRECKSSKIIGMNVRVDEIELRESEKE